MQRAIRFLLALLLAGAIYLGLAAYAAAIFTVAPRTFDPNNNPAKFGLDFHEVRFSSRTPGLELAGWYMPNPGSTRALVMVHGHTSSRSSEFGGGIGELAAALHQRGFAVLAIDLRGHGTSDAAPIGFGTVEHDDVAGALDWLRAEGFATDQLGVFGVSMGGAASIRALADDPEVAALVVDGTPAVIQEVVQRQWTQNLRLPEFFLSTTLFVARMRYGIDLEANAALNAMPRLAPRPVLIIHGLDDPLILPDHAERLAAALPSAELWLIAGSGHAQNFATERERYLARVADFFDRHVPAQSPRP